MKIKKIILIVCAVAPLLLTGCNKEMQDAKNASEERRLIEQLAHKERIRERELQNRLALAEVARRLELAKQAKFHAVMEPLVQFSVIVLTSGGLVWGFRFLKFAHEENNANRALQRKTVQEEHKTIQYKYELACSLVLKPEFFAQLSDEHRTQVLKRLDKPPHGESQSPPETNHQPFKERVYDDLKGWASRRRAS